jgi:hypothetical protein
VLQSHLPALGSSCRGQLRPQQSPSHHRVTATGRHNAAPTLLIDMLVAVDVGDLMCIPQGEGSAQFTLRQVTAPRAHPVPMASLNSTAQAGPRTMASQAAGVSAEAGSSPSLISLHAEHQHEQQGGASPTQVSPSELALLRHEVLAVRAAAAEGERQLLAAHEQVLAAAAEVTRLRDELLRVSAVLCSAWSQALPCHAGTAQDPPNPTHTAYCSLSAMWLMHGRS